MNHNIAQEQNAQGPLQSYENDESVSVNQVNTSSSLGLNLTKMEIRSSKSSGFPCLPLIDASNANGEKRKICDSDSSSKRARYQKLIYCVCDKPPEGNG